MKVMQLADGFYPLIGGGSIAIRSWVENMPKVQFEIVTNAIHGLKNTERYSENCVINRFLPYDISKAYDLPGGGSKYQGKTKVISFPYKLFSEWMRFSRKVKFLQNASYDLMNFNGPVTNYGFFTFDRKIKRNAFTNLIDFSTIKKPKILTLHGLPSFVTNNKIDINIEKKMMNMFDNIICVDYDIYKKFEDYCKESGEDKKVWFIPNPVDTSIFQNKPFIKREKLTVGIYARLGHKPGLDLLIEVVNNASDNMKFEIICLGTQSQLTALSQKIKNKNVKLIFNLQYNQIPAYINSFDILFNPVMVPCISRFTLEAMSCGRPVMMVDMGNRYPIISRKTGFLVSPNSKAIIESFENISSERDLPEHIGKNAMEIVKKEFDVSIICPKLENIYTEVINSH